jgi:catechol 2,3-dioxygenase-like lactoylglutathione lyase family enzyme
VIDHIGFEVSDLVRSGQFYDALFRALGARRMFESEHAVSYGVNAPMFWIVVRGRTPGPGYGHVALAAVGKAAVDAAWEAGVVNGGRDDGAPGRRPQYGEYYYSGYLLDPDGLRVEIVSRR